MLVSLTLGGSMRWDIRHPEKRFGDRFVLVAGHTVPLIYSMLAVLQHGVRASDYERDRRPALRRSPTTASGQLDWELTCSASGGAAGWPATPRWRARPSS